MNDFLISNIHLTYIGFCGFYRDSANKLMHHPIKPYHSINLLVSGHCTFRFDHGQEFHVHPNDFFYLPQNTPYSVFFEETSTYYSIVFDFMGEKSRNYEYFSLSVQNDPRFLTNFQQFINAYTRKKVGYLNRCYQYFYTLIGDIQSKMNAQYISSSQADLLRKADAYIRENLSSPDLSVNALCEVLGISSRYFLDLFKKKYAVSPKKYITHQRLHMACTLLNTTTLSIQEISEQVGFNDTTHFSTKFKKVLHTSPSEYRKNQSSMNPRQR